MSIRLLLVDDQTRHGAQAGEAVALHLVKVLDRVAQRVIVGQRLDQDGNVSRIALCNSLDEDVYSAIARSERMVTRMEQLLGGEVYHYHSKMNMKEPRIGGAWTWHQDYGYWYQNGCLFPHMASVMIAVDPATRENGCLQVIRDSHKFGRVEHGAIGSDAGRPELLGEAVACLLEQVEGLLLVDDHRGRQGHGSGLFDQVGHPIEQMVDLGHAVRVAARLGGRHEENLPSSRFATWGGTIEATSPPNRAISRMSLDARKEWDEADGYVSRLMNDRRHRSFVYSRRREVFQIVRTAESTLRDLLNDGE